MENVLENRPGILAMEFLQKTLYMIRGYWNPRSIRDVIKPSFPNNTTISIMMIFPSEENTPEKVEIRAFIPSTITES